MQLRRLAVVLTLGLTLVLGACGGSEDDGDDDTASGPDAGAATVDAAGGGSIAFMEQCDPEDDQCETDLVCFNFNSRGPHCTHACTVDSDCAAPSPGCNNMGVCKAP
jgi:hypothetical protein